MVVNSYIKRMMRDRANTEIIEKLAVLWDKMTEDPGNTKNARRAAEEIGLDLRLEDVEQVAFINFHARRMKSGEDYPTGDQMKGAIDELEPPKPRPEPPRGPYGGGSKNRPWGRST
jgi:hypothetical protein